MNFVRRIREKSLSISMVILIEITARRQHLFVLIFTRTEKKVTLPTEYQIHIAFYTLVIHLFQAPEIQGKKNQIPTTL